MSSGTCVEQDYSGYKQATDSSSLFRSLVKSTDLLKRLDLIMSKYNSYLNICFNLFIYFRNGLIRDICVFIYFNLTSL